MKTTSKHEAEIKERILSLRLEPVLSKIMAVWAYPDGYDVPDYQDRIDCIDKVNSFISLLSVASFIPKPVKKSIDINQVSIDLNTLITAYLDPQRWMEKCMVIENAELVRMNESVGSILKLLKSMNTKEGRNLKGRKQKFKVMEKVTKITDVEREIKNSKGESLVFIGYDPEMDGLIAEYCPKDLWLNDSFTDEDIIQVVVGFEKQSIGEGYPLIDSSDPWFDQNFAIEEALHKADDYVESAKYERGYLHVA